MNLNEFGYKPLDKLDTCNSPITFLYLGGLVTDLKHDKYNYKGGITLLKAWKSLYFQIDKGKIGAKLTFGGPNVNKAIVAQILEEDPTVLNIDVAGQVPINEVKNYIAQSTVVIVPSLAEGLPNVAMEAAAIGRPVIGSLVGGIPEIVIHSKTGLLFKSGNDEELCNLIELYIANPEQVLIHGTNAHKHVINNFDSKSFIEKYLEIYKDITSKNL